LKKIWNPSFPSSLDDNIMKGLVGGITGLQPAARSFYTIVNTNGEKFRKCKDKTGLAVCMLVHPIVQMNANELNKSRDTFNENVIFVLRNPITLIPAFHNMKQIKYNGRKGQVPETSWREYRDHYLEEVMGGWINQIDTWKKMDGFKIAFYLAHEEIMDMVTGPSKLTDFSIFLEKNGYEVPEPESIPCIYRKVMGHERLEQYQKYKYEYSDYIPGYTETQKSYLVATMNDLIEKYRSDEELTRILKVYLNVISSNTRLDNSVSDEKIS